MYCQECGVEVKDKAVVCLNCGCAVKSVRELKPAWGAWAMVGLSLATIVIPLLGWVVGAFHLKGERQGQSIYLICLGVVAWVVYMATM
jgi:hypothetical protein